MESYPAHSTVTALQEYYTSESYASKINVIRAVECQVAARRWLTATDTSLLGRDAAGVTRKSVCMERLFTFDVD